MSRHLRRRVLNYVPALASPALYVLLVSWGHVDPLGHVSSSSKGVAYQTLAGVAGAVLSLGVVSFSVLFAVSPRSRLAAVLAVNPAIRLWLTGSFVALGVALLGFAALIPLDPRNVGNGGRYVAVGLFFIVVTALAELIYLADRTFHSLSREIGAEQASASSAGGFRVIDPDDANFQIPTRRSS